MNEGLIFLLTAGNELSMKGGSLSDRVRSSVIMDGFRVEPLLLHIERSWCCAKRDRLPKTDLFPFVFLCVMALLILVNRL